MGCSLLIWLAALLSPASGEMTPPQSSAQDEIRALTRQFVEGFNSGNLDKVMRFYAAEYVDVNLPEPHQSWTQRREYYRKIMAGGTKVAVEPKEIITPGDHAYVWGSILVSQPHGKARELRYVEIWQHFKDGWKSVWGMDADLYPAAE